MKTSINISIICSYINLLLLFVSNNRNKNKKTHFLIPEWNQVLRKACRRNPGTLHTWEIQSVCRIWSSSTPQLTHRQTMSHNALPRPSIHISQEDQTLHSQPEDFFPWFMPFSILNFSKTVFILKYLFIYVFILPTFFFFWLCQLMWFSMSIADEYIFKDVITVCCVLVIYP